MPPPPSSVLPSGCSFVWGSSEGRMRGRRPSVDDEIVDAFYYFYGFFFRGRSSSNVNNNHSILLTWVPSLQCVFPLRVATECAVMKYRRL